MTLLTFTHASMLAHGEGLGHIEAPQRLTAALRALDARACERREAPFASREHVERVHPRAYVDHVEAAFRAAESHVTALDGDTVLTRGSREAVWRAAGAGVAAIDAVMGGEADAAFCAVRPPGHHAEPGRAMGFCVFNNIAVAALHALEGAGATRVAIVDFDVHHGNGTQTVAEGDARLLFASTHQSPLYPGTGRAGETGAHGNIVNVPLPAGADGVLWRRAMEERVLPALDAFRPDLLLVSAGFDAHRSDPLAEMALTEEDYRWAGVELRRAARACGEGRVIAMLEGGYDLEALESSVGAFVDGLQESP